MNPEQFYQALEQEGIVLSEQQRMQFHRYFEMLVEWNQKMNLTAITDQEGVYLKHFYDSLQLIKGADFSLEKWSICDVGAGAGFPSLPLKIVYPQLRITIVDSLNKRITFLNTLVKELELKDVMCYHGRAETFGQDPQFREKFDIVTARAVAKLSVLSEFCIPLVKKQGYFIALKASHSKDELAVAQKAIAILGGKVEADYANALPYEAGERHVIRIKKTKETPKKYPRNPGVPAKRPL